MTSDQVTLSGFEPPHEKEQVLLERLWPLFQNAAAALGASANRLSVNYGKSYSTVRYGSSAIFRLKLRGKVYYIAVPQNQGYTLHQISSSKSLKITDNYIRMQLPTDENFEYEKNLILIVEEFIRHLPSDWDCCSRYMECSNAKQCVHPDKEFSLGCGYRRILASGRIFYGENRNID